MNVLVFKSDKNSQWYWRVSSGNGKVIAQSEGYKRKSGAIKGIRALHCEATKPLHVTIEKVKK